MSVSTALGNVTAWRDRQRARNNHERLDSMEDHELDLEDVQIAEPPAAEATTAATTTASTTTTTRRRTSESEVSDTANAATTTTRGRSSRSVSLQELEEERELARRRTSACVLLAVFVLFRLWIEAIATGDFGLLMLCLVGTSWTARWIRHNREREEELDRRIQQLVENSENPTRHDLRMLSFQAQLALAIMESQRQMMQGGFGHPDGEHGASMGVTTAVRDQWEHFQFSAAEGYGSVNKEDGGEEPHCSICLGEYETGEKLVRLPCHHDYHGECINSWTENHVRCPLCNFDLMESASSSAESTNDGSSTAATSNNEDSVV